MHLRRILMTGVATFAIAATSLPAFAADPTDVVVAAGGLAISTIAVGDFAGVTLDGTAKTTTATMDGFNVNDARATGAGWNVTVQATQLAEHNGTAYVASGKTLAANSLSMPAPTVAANGTTSAAPSMTGGPYTIDAASAVKIASAATDAGMGSYDFTQGGSLTLSVPTSTYARTYRSDVTVSVVSGP
jgi:hypothetical protein